MWLLFKKINHEQHMKIVAKIVKTSLMSYLKTRSTLFAMLTFRFQMLLQPQDNHTDMIRNKWEWIRNGSNLDFFY